MNKSDVILGLGTDFSIIVNVVFTFISDQKCSLSFRNQVKLSERVFVQILYIQCLDGKYVQCYIKYSTSKGSLHSRKKIKKLEFSNFYL